MLVGYADKDIEKLCENERIAIKKLGKPLAMKLFQRLEWIDAASTLDTLNKLHNTLRIHKLSGNYDGCYALDLDARNRLIFYPCDDDGEFVEAPCFANVTVITIEEVSNHYGD